MMIDWAYWGWTVAVLLFEAGLAFAIAQGIAELTDGYSGGFVSLLGDVSAAGLLLFFGSEIILVGEIENIGCAPLGQAAKDVAPLQPVVGSIISDASKTCTEHAEKTIGVGEQFVTSLGMNPVLAAVVIYLSIRGVAWIIFNYDRIISMIAAVENMLRRMLK